MQSCLPIARWQTARRCVLALCARALAVSWLLLAAVTARPQAKPSEYDVKAAYLLNFGKFMRFAGPQPGNPTFDICILGRDPMGAGIDQMAANDSINGHPVRLQRVGDATQGKKCQILYISLFEGTRTREDLAILSGSDVLTVGDIPDFLELGGMIQFVLQSDHVRFNVNLNAVNRTHIVLSSELLRVAASVQGKPQAGGRR